MLFLAAVVLISVSNLVQAQWNTAACPNGYQIQSGDTFYKLGGSDVGGMCAWLNANPGVDPCTLKIGACLNYPKQGYTSTYCPSNYNTYSCFSGIAATGNYYGTGYYAGPTYATNTGAYYPSGNTGAYYPSGNTGAYYPSGNTGAYYPSGNTGAYYPSGNTGAYYGGYSNPYGYGSGNWACGSGQRVIQSGDSFYGLGGGNAGACAWMAANPGVDPCQLKVGYCLNPPTYAYNSYNANCVLPTCNNYGRK